jgi:hypothetical protein
MATVSPRNSQALKRTAVKGSTTAVGQPPNQSVVESPTTIPAQPSNQVASALTPGSIDTIFRQDADLRKTFTTNLKQRSVEVKNSKDAATLAFKTFDASSMSADERKQRGYLAPDGDLEEALNDIIKEDTKALSRSKIKRSLALRDTKELRSLITPVRGRNGLIGRVRLARMKEFIDNKAFILYNPRHVYTACEAEVEAARHLAQIEGTDGKTDGQKEQGKKDGQKEQNNETRQGSYADAAGLAKEQVSIQMETATSPESKLAFNVTSRSDQNETQKHIDSFELRDGASDVTAFHDFSSLQIAFRHLWREIFDGRLTEMGEELYANYVKLSDMTYKDRRYKNIRTVDELKKLMAEIRHLLTNAQNVTPFDLKEDKHAAIKRFLFGEGDTTNTTNSHSSDENSRIYTLLDSLDKILEHPYAFHVFVPNSINFGIQITYRQKWEPKKYQVGELVSTIPLAPKEVRRYTTRRVSKKTRNIKELEDALRTQRSEMSNTARADNEIVEKAVNKDTFTLTAHGSYGDKGYNVSADATSVKDSTTESANIKKEFRESVIKSAQEYRQQNRMEIDTSEVSESEDTTFHEIQNPNDELTVTYLFYELQRQYEISEKLYRLTPVILVANQVPRPDEITDAWLMQHDWILRRVTLDDSFRPAMEYLTKGFVGAELNIRILRDNAASQKQVVDKISQQIQRQIQILSADEKAVADALNNVSLAQVKKGALDSVKRIFDPIGITGDTSKAPVEAAQTTVDYAKEALDRSMREKARLLEELNLAVTALQAAVDKLSTAVKEHYERLTEIDRLRVHIKENILYYMQAIWSHEPPDQRFFRIYSIPVPDIEAKTTNVDVDVYEKRKSAVLPGAELLTALPMPEVKLSGKTLVEIADIDNLLGFKGNYMIFPLRKNNYITLHMMQDYIEIADQIGLRDPDEFGEYTLNDLQRFATCLRTKNLNVYKEYRDEIKLAIIDRLMSGRKDSELVVVPTTSLYIEALVGTHPLLEDFKLIHRALDVKKVQAEVRHAELENIRLAARALRGKDDDPDIEKKIVVETGGQAITVQPDVD